MRIQCEATQTRYDGFVLEENGSKQLCKGCCHHWDIVQMSKPQLNLQMWVSNSTCNPNAKLTTLGWWYNNRVDQNRNTCSKQEESKVARKRKLVQRKERWWEKGVFQRRTPVVWEEAHLYWKAYRWLYAKVRAKNCRLQDEMEVVKQVMLKVK